MKTIILFAAVAVAACNSIHSKAGVTANKTTPMPANAVHQAEVPRVTTTELDDLMKQGKVVVIDVRTQDMYDKGHIRGAKLIPVNQIGERGKELPRDKKIVTYCS
jgi:3-mercaptopyruvate sulfurtransferase SseA